MSDKTNYKLNILTGVLKTVLAAISFCTGITYIYKNWKNLKSSNVVAE